MRIILGPSEEAYQPVKPGKTFGASQSARRGCR
jgi:hypothetical protein